MCLHYIMNINNLLYVVLEVKNMKSKSLINIALIGASCIAVSVSFVVGSKAHKDDFSLVRCLAHTRFLHCSHYVNKNNIVNKKNFSNWLVTKKEILQCPKSTRTYTEVESKLKKSVSEVHLCHWNNVYKISNVYTL